jgi:hypothetical protein
MGIRLPNVYFLFYDYFFKSSVGDARWKKSCMDDTDMTSPIGSVQAEAFAMLQLKNNYFAWLLEAKQKMPVILVTDYDTEGRRSGLKTASEVYLKNLQIDIGTTDNERVLVVEGDEKYDDLKKFSEDGIKKARQDAKKNKMFKEVKKALEAMQQEASTAASEREGEEQTNMCQEEERRMRQRKKRKILKPLREYTTPQGEEGKFKGWSTRAANDMAALCKQLKEQSMLCVRFRVAYRKIYQARNKDKPRQDRNDQIVEVDYKELWDIENVGVQEI